MKFLILAGGSGTRLWPVSRKNKPKQVQPFFDSSSLLFRAFNRLIKFFKANDIFVITNAKQAKLIVKELPKLKKQHLIIEPEPRGTLAAIGFGSQVINKYFPGEAVATIMSDHHIKDIAEYARMLRQSEKSVKQFPYTITLLGVRPSYPETGYGYIKMASQKGKIKSPKGADEIFTVEKFVEKPTFAQAQRYIKQWEYLWNPAHFIFYPETLLKFYQKYNPPAGRALAKISWLLKFNIKSKEIISRFKAIPKDSIDYGLLEKAKGLLVMPSDFGWTDVGHWRSVYDIIAKHSKENIVKGKYLGIKSHGNLVYSLADKLIATIGVDNFVIIETEDAILICPKKLSQEVREVVKKLEENNLKKYL